MYTVLAFVLALASTVALVRPALACNDSTVRGKVLGVGPDGGWVYLVTSSGGGAEGESTTLMRYAPDGTIIATRHLCDPDDLDGCEDPCEVSDEPGRACHGKPPLAPFVGERAAATLPFTLTRGLEARIVRHLQLTPLRSGTARLNATQHEEAEGDQSICNVVTASTVDGRVEVLALTGYDTDFRCPAVAAKLYEHSRAAFRFARIEHGLTADCGTDRDSYVWFPRDRIKTMRLMARAMKLAPIDRLPLLREVVVAEPGYVPARIAQAQALYDSDVAWSVAIETMSVPWVAPTWSGSIQDFVDALTGESFERWHGDALDAWVSGLPMP